MRKRSQASGTTSTKPSAAERAVALPIEKPALVSHDGFATCPTCDENVMLGKCTKRENGRFECSSCGGLLAENLEITSSTTTAERKESAERASNNARKLTLQEQADADQAAHHEEVERTGPAVEMQPQNGGLAGYCGDCGAAWPFLKGELHKSCGHMNAERVEHPTEAKKISPPAGQQRQDENSTRARPLVTNNYAGAVPPPTNRISIPWGEARCPVDQYNNFKCGGFIVTVDLAPGEDRVEVAERIGADMEKIADKMFERQHAWYLKKLGLLGVPDY